MKPKRSPKECLDSQQQALAAKHRSRLHSMTQEALLSQQSRYALPSIWQSAWFKPTIATAFSFMLVTTLVFFIPAEKQTGFAEPELNLPQWVTDTDVPLTLIENLEFYDWLAQQPENRQATLQKSLTLALNEFYQYRFSKRLAAFDLAEGFSGATHYARTIQR